MIIAHRLGVLASADRLLVMRDGAVERIGPRDEIMAALQGKPSQPPGGNVVGMKGA